MASNVHLGNGNAAGNPEFETESEIPATVVEVAPEKELQPVADCPTVTELTTAVETTVPNKKRRGDCLFRVIVPVHKVESIIGRNGDLIERMCQETKAHIKVLVVPVSYPSRVVQISSKEDREAPLSPAMDAVIRVFKLINGFPENESDGVPSNSPCSIRLLVPSVQAMSLIEMQGSSINTIHKDVGFSVCIRSTWKKEKISAKSDDRVVELQGKGLKVLKALKAVLEHLRMLLVDHSIPPLFKNTVTKRLAVSRYKAGDIIGVEGTNIANIGRTSGAVLTVHESNNRIAVELKGNPSQVKAATQLLDIQIKTVNDRARPAVSNKPISQPQEGTTLGFCPTDVDQALTGSPELPQVQIATAPKPIETKAEVPPELPQVQPATALKAVETKPVMRASSDDSNVVEEAIQQVEAEEPVIPTRPELVGPAILDGMAHISESKRSRVSWEDENVDKTFLDACIHEIAINGRESGSLNAKSWKKVGEILKERHNFCVDHKQMKNYFDALESRYKSWLMLKNKIDNIYDPSLDDEMKKNKYIETLKNESPPLPDLCAKLFDGALSKSFVETRIQKDTMSIASPSSPVDYKKRKGEVTHEPQAAGPLVPPSAQTSVPEAPVEPQKEPKRIRVCWNVSTAKTFLEACIHEITFNGREAGSLKAMSWKKVEEILKDRHNFSVDSNQMKSYFNGLKNKYKAWLLLKNKFGNKYDSSTNKFNFTEKERETEMKKNKCIESLRKAPLRFPDLCAQLLTMLYPRVFQTAATSPSAETSPPLAATETRHEGECEVQEVCSSLLQVPAELPQVQTATALNTIETKVEAPPEVPQVQPATALKAVETTVEVPPELPEVQPANALEAIDTKIEVPPETPEVQPATALKAMETEAEVPTKLPQVQPASAPEAIETKPQEPVLLAKTGTGEAFLGPVRPVVLNCPDFHPPDQTAPGVDQDLTGLACHSKKRCCPMLSLPQVAAGPLGTDSIKESKRNRYLWNDDIVKTFLDECIREIAINGQDGGSLKAVSWKKVGEILKATHNYYADTKQMKNYFDGLKSKYIAWLSLKNKFGNKYDPATNTFNLTDKEWGTEIKKNKCIEELRLGPLRFPDLCAQLFDGVISTGVDQPLTGPEPGEIIEPQEAVPFVPPSAETSPPSAATEAPVEPQKEPIMCSSLVEVPPELPPVQAPSEVVEIQIKRPMSVFEEEMLDVLKVIADKINRPQPPSKPTFEDCEKKLNELGWRKNDPLYLVALTIFCDKNNHYRELWMKLNPNLCADWVRMIGRSKGFT